VVTGDAIFLSAAGDLRGENALSYIPQVGATASEVMLNATHVTKVDAVTACAFRALIEHYARRGATRVVMAPPSDSATARLLIGLLGPELPKHFCFANDSEVPTGRRPQAVVLPATVIRSFDEADLIAGVLPQLGTSQPGRPRRFLEGAFGELVDNAIEWGSDSPIGAVIAAVHERHGHVLQLAVTDLGARIASRSDARDELERLVQASTQEERGLSLLAAQAVRLDLDLRLEVASGSGRASWVEGAWSFEETQAVAGFTAAVSISL
jgi:hypothetical protein